jgi:hypothetical protein
VEQTSQCEQPSVEQPNQCEQPSVEQPNQYEQPSECEQPNMEQPSQCEQRRAGQQPVINRKLRKYKQRQQKRAKFAEMRFVSNQEIDTRKIPVVQDS